MGIALCDRLIHLFEAKRAISQDGVRVEKWRGIDESVIPPRLNAQPQVEFRRAT